MKLNELIFLLSAGVWAGTVFKLAEAGKRSGGSSTEEGDSTDDAAEDDPELKKCILSFLVFINQRIQVQSEVAQD